MPKINFNPLRRRDNKEERSPYSKAHEHHERSQTKVASSLASPEYPRELTSMFGSWKCDLCEVEFTNQIGAKLHYSGKRHIKNIKKFLFSWSKRTGCPMPDIPDIKKPDNEKELDITNEYCEYCDVTIKSANERLLHYSSKNHLKYVANPASARKQNKVREELNLCLKSESEVIDPETKKYVKIDTTIKEFVCYLCNVKVNTQDQFETHIAGKRHKANRESILEGGPTISIAGSSNPLEAEEKEDRIIENLSHLYCFICKKQYFTFSQYTEHLFQEKHLNLSTQPDLNSKTNLYRCSACKILVEEINRERHEQQGSHLKACVKEEILASLTQQMQQERSACTVVHCTHCKVVCDTFIQYSNHVLSEQHLDILVQEKQIAERLAKYQ